MQEGNEHQTEQGPNVSVWMIHRDLKDAPRYPLPRGYRLRPYRDGDVATWVRLQQDAERFFTPTAETFIATIPGDTALLSRRVTFLVDPAGDDIGTITAWNDATLTGSDSGQIHWVALARAVQSRGLSKPLLSAACDALLALGYTEAWLETGTGRIPALNLYLQFGFVPYLRGEIDRAGWLVVAPHLKFAPPGIA